MYRLELVLKATVFLKSLINMNSPSPKQDKQNLSLPEGATKEIITTFLKNTSEQINLEKLQTNLEEKRIESNERLAIKAMGFQSEDIKARPKEARKTIITVSIIGLTFLILIALFIAFLLMQKQEEFAWGILKAVTYLIAIAFGYYAGKKTKPGKNANPSEMDIQDPELMD